MISETAFKLFCIQAASGVPQRGLFITPDSPSRDEQKIGMINMATERGLDTMYRHPDRTLDIGNGAMAYLRIAHPYLDRELKGLEWHFIEGLQYLDAFDEGERIQNELMARVRR